VPAERAQEEEEEEEEETPLNEALTKEENQEHKQSDTLSLSQTKHIDRQTGRQTKQRPCTCVVAVFTGPSLYQKCFSILTCSPARPSPPASAPVGASFEKARARVIPI